MSQVTNEDTKWMHQALAMAREAEAKGEVPIGAVLVVNNQQVAAAHNGPIALCDPTAHAEILVMRQYAQLIENYRLLGATLYVTLEPCPMCVGAMVHARIERCVFGAFDPRQGALASAIPLADFPNLNHQLSFDGGVLESESAALLKAFFRSRR